MTIPETEIGAGDGRRAAGGATRARVSLGLSGGVGGGGVGAGGRLARFRLRRDARREPSLGARVGEERRHRLFDLGIEAGDAQQRLPLLAAVAKSPRW